MPKKTKSSWVNCSGRANPEKKSYFGHDDRVARIEGPGFTAGNRPRVSFKPQARPTRDIPRNLALACLNDDDAPMTGSSNNNNNRQVVIRGRGRGLSRGRNSPVPHRSFRSGGASVRSRQLAVGDCNWYKISIPYGHKYEKKYILSNLQSYIAPDTFVPIMYKVIGSEAVFFVDDQKTANALLNCDRKITTNDGFKLNVRVRPGFPQCEIDDKLKERLKQAMAKRYVQETNALDLSRFHQDPDLVTDYFCALFRPVMLMAVLEIVEEHIPNLEALNLDGNKLHIIERLNVLNKKFPKLKILYIGDNKIREINQIDVLKDLKLEELRLAGNPVCNKYKTRQSDYISDVRKRFPRLLRLDGTELPRPILFDVADESTKTPPTQRIFTASAKAQEIASQFLQQYFQIFDSENRQPLLDAYDEHAYFSMTIFYNQNVKPVNKPSGYLLENRNLFRINDNNKRQKLLKQGRLPVVSFISEMPRTTHYLNTFTMDVSLVTDGMMLIVVTGLFKEMDNKEQSIRFFNRTLIVVPEGSGYCIRNEQLHINNATEAQLRLLDNLTSEANMSDPRSYPGSYSVPSISGNMPGHATPSVSGTSDACIAKPALPEDVRQQMTVTLSQQTNMNLEWSLKCLEEVRWNYDNALSAFQEFFKRGQIPPEAFTK